MRRSRRTEAPQVVVEKRTGQQLDSVYAQRDEPVVCIARKPAGGDLQGDFAEADRIEYGEQTLEDDPVMIFPEGGRASANIGRLDRLVRRQGVRIIREFGGDRTGISLRSIGGFGAAGRAFCRRNMDVDAGHSRAPMPVFLDEKICWI